jgi:hypothetical protein
LGCDDDSGPGLDPSLVCCVPAASAYALEVRDFQDNHAISFYSLSVLAMAGCVPSGPCAVAPDQLGCPATGFAFGGSRPGGGVSTP